MNNLMKRKFLLVISSVYILSFACNQIKDTAVSFIEVNGEKILVCDVDKITETRTMNLSEIVEEFGVVKLKNDTAGLVGQFATTVFSNNHFLFGDMQNQLLLYNKEGKFIKKWQPGRGPLEFVVPGNPQYIDGIMYINDPISSKTIAYDIETGTAKATKYQINNSSATVLPDHSILCLAYLYSPDEPLLSRYNQEGEILQSIVTESSYIHNTRVSGFDHSFYPISDGWNIHISGNDTLMFFDVQENKLIPSAIFESTSNLRVKAGLLAEMRKKDNKRDNIKADLTNFLYAIPEFESERYYFLRTSAYGNKRDPDKYHNRPWYWAQRKLAMLDKESNEVFYVSFQNDFWGGIPFGPDGDLPFWSADIAQDRDFFWVKKWFTSYLDKKDHMIDDVIRERMNDLLYSLNEEDNNVVFWYRLKK